MQRLSRAWERWVAFWDEREAPYALGLVRILLGICLVWDFSQAGLYGLVDALYAPAEAGGLSDAFMRDNQPLFYELFPATVESGRLLWGTMVAASAALTLGVFTRTSALTLLIAWSQYAQVASYSDRGIDTLCRLILVVLVFAPSGAWASFDAWRRTGSVWGDGSPELSWARKLIIAQLVLMYFSAGVLKTGFTWWPWGGSTALYFALQDPAVGAYDFTWLHDQPVAVFFTQMGSVSTLLYQWTYPLVFLLMWWRRHPEKGGRLAAFTNRYRLEFLWVGIGAVFHLILAAVMELGIFPWAMLALYPVWLHPDEWKRLWEGARNFVFAAVAR